MKVCLDVHCHERTASAAALVFDDWATSTPVARYRSLVPGCAKYEPGRFYQRELAPLLAVIECIVEPIEVLIIDAYCTLAADGTPGLGAHLFASTGEQAVVVGVAKSRLRNTDHAEEICRGVSRRPLFITSLGLPQPVAAEKIASMAGRHRIPTLLKLVDQLAREP